MLGYEWFDWQGFFSRGTALAKWHRVGEIVQRFCRWKVGEGPGAGSGGCPRVPACVQGGCVGCRLSPALFPLVLFLDAAGFWVSFLSLSRPERLLVSFSLLGAPRGGLPKPRPLVAAVGWDLAGAGSLLFRL